MTATNDALALLPQATREAIAICDRDMPEIAGNGSLTAWGYVRAELLRLARKDAAWLSRWNSAVNRYERAEAERDALRKRIDEAPTGTVIEAGDDVDGQPRVLIHSTRDELRKGGPIMFKNVSLVVRE